MIKRIIEINHPSYLKIKQNQLCIEQGGKQVGTAPIEDIGILLLSHREIILTSSVTTRLIENKAAIIHCDHRYMPCAYTLPLDNNTTHSAVLKAQMTAKLPIKKRVWQQIVQAKIEAQARVLALYSEQEAQALFTMAKRVKSDDTDNKEAQAAQYYWRKLFDKQFRRNPDETGVNAFLNYGYAIIRASVARAICAAGLHPALGIHHTNQYNAFCLSDDLMEPLRPMVDWQVQTYLQNFKQSELEINQESKKILLELVSASVLMNQRQLPLMVALHEYTASFKRVLQGEEQQLQIPFIELI